MHLLIPLLNKNRYTLTAWIMKSERLAFKHLSTLSRGETAIASTYYLLFDMPGLFFLSLSYTTLVYAFSVPMLPILSIISLAVVLVSLFVVLFSSYNRGITDLLSQQYMSTVMISMRLSKLERPLKNYKLRND